VSSRTVKMTTLNAQLHMVSWTDEKIQKPAVHEFTSPITPIPSAINSVQVGGAAKHKEDV